jgi:hypothetical protein
MVAVGQESPAQGLEDPRLMLTEVIRRDQIERLAGFWLIFIVPMGAIPGLAVGDFVRGEAEQFSSPASSAISIVAPSRVPMVSAPFIMNFMLLVPLAS